MHSHMHNATTEHTRQIIEPTKVVYKKTTYEDWKNFVPQDSQKVFFENLHHADKCYLVDHHMSYTIYINDIPMVLGGVIEKSSYRGTLWSYLHKDLGKHMVAFVRSIKVVIPLLEFHRLEIVTDPESETQTRLAKMLGFELEAKLYKYDALGNDVNMWIIKNDL